VVFHVGFQPVLGYFSCVGAQSFYHTCKEFGALPACFVTKDGLFTLHHTKDGQLSNECRKKFL
jgi:hypothetical protein